MKDFELIPITTPLREIIEDMVSSRNENKPKLWSIHMDMVEYDDRYSAVAELLEVEKENISASVRVRDNSLIIRGKKKDSYVKLEISIPFDVDIEKISASYKDGVLKLTLPKSTKVEEKEINIKFE